MSRPASRNSENTTTGQTQPGMLAEWDQLAAQLDGQRLPKTPRPERMRAPRRPGRLKKAGLAALAAAGVVSGAVASAVGASEFLDRHKEPGMFASPNSGVAPRSPDEMPSMGHGERVGVFNTTTTSAPPEVSTNPRPVLDVVDREGNVTEILTPLSELPPLQRLENSLNASLASATTESADLEGLVSPAAQQWAGDIVAAYGQDPEQPQLYFTTVSPEGAAAEVSAITSEEAGEVLRVTDGSLFLMRGGEVAKAFGAGSTITVMPHGETDLLSVAHLVADQPEQG
jgi:hypothetical protein